MTHKHAIANAIEALQYCARSPEVRSPFDQADFLVARKALEGLKALRDAVPDKHKSECGPWCKSQETSNAYCKNCNGVFEWEAYSAKLLSEAMEVGE